MMQESVEWTRSIETRWANIFVFYRCVGFAWFCFWYIEERQMNQWRGGAGVKYFQNHSRWNEKLNKLKNCWDTICDSCAYMCVMYVVLNIKSAYKKFTSSSRYCHQSDTPMFWSSCQRTIITPRFYTSLLSRVLRAPTTRTHGWTLAMLTLSSVQLKLKIYHTDKTWWDYIKRTNLSVEMAFLWALFSFVGCVCFILIFLMFCATWVLIFQWNGEWKVSENIWFACIVG